MSVTASALLAGSGGANPRLLEARAATTKSEMIVPDPQATPSEQVVLTLLKTVEPEKAMSLDQILASAPSLKRTTAPQLLKKLEGQGKISKIGNGQSYRYYNPRAADERKLAEATKTISDLLFGLTAENAISLPELLAKRPGLDRGIAEKAIRDLLKQGKIRQTGDDTQNRPLRFYDRSRGGHGM
jgi:ribosomal protein S25